MASAVCDLIRGCHPRLYKKSFTPQPTAPASRPATAPRVAQNNPPSDFSPPRNSSMPPAHTESPQNPQTSPAPDPTASLARIAAVPPPGQSSVTQNFDQT